MLGIKQINTIHMLDLCDALEDNPKWKVLGRRLGLSDATIDNIEMENRTSRDRIYEMLRKYKMMNGSRATVLTLVNACEESKIPADVYACLFK